MNARNDEPEYLTLVQASKLLQVSQNTLRNWDGSRGPSSNRCGFSELRIRQVRMGREAIAEELKYELANTQAPNYTIFQPPR